MKAVNVDEVLKILHKYGKYIFVTDEKRYSSMVDEIANLKALEHKPKSEWQQDHEILKAYSDGANDVLDEIKADIEQTTSRYCLSIEHSALGHVVWSDRLIKESEVLEIIDKYKAEGSDKE